ncbi:MAG: prepilin-type N-terminal cleavage/methylation domain-containing protein [Patescibacteria group bacterium]
MRGFSLTELLVTVSIFVIVAGVVLVNFPSFSSRIALENLAHEIALVVRQAQVFGVASREFGPGSGIFPTHGAHFDISANTSFTLFADTNENGLYGGSGELIETLRIQRGNVISSLCGYATASSPCTSLDTLHITFTRPDPEARIIGSAGGSSSEYSYSTITVRSTGGNTNMVTVWSNGQIAVQ